MKPTTPTAPPPPEPKHITSARSVGDKSTEPLPVMERHRTVFEQTKARLEKTLGKAPTCDDLMRLWLATATPGDVACVFESAVLDIGGSEIMPLPGEDYNQSLLGF